MAKRNNENDDANEPTAAERAVAANDSVLLDGLLEYLDDHIGALEMVYEAVDEGREQISPEIPRRPADALDSVIDGITEKTLQVRTDRELASGLAQMKPGDETKAH